MEGRRMGGARGIIPVEKPKNFWQTSKRLLGYFKNEKSLISFVVLLIIVDGAIVLAIPYIIGRAVDIISLNTIDSNLLKITVAALAAGYAADSLCTFIQGWIMAGVSQRIIKGFRSGLFGKLQKLSTAFFDLHTHGDIMSRLSNDIENVSTTISQSTVQLLSGIFAVLGTLVMMIILSPLLTLAAVVTVPLALILTKTIAGKTAVLFKKQQQDLGKLNGHIEEAISGISVIKAFNYEDKIIDQFDKLNNSLRDVGLKAQIWTGYLMPLMNVINNIGFALIAFTGGILAIKGLISIGVIASFISYSRQFSRPFSDFANIFNTLQSAAAGAERVFEILDELEEEKDVQGARELKDVKGDVVFENVSFGYRPDIPIIKNISFSVKSGDSIALVGATGAGKTTLVNLVSRFYDVTSGRILIDGTDIKEYTRDSLRKCFGIVLQDTYLFSGTIKENIKYGNLEASDEEVMKAADMAGAHTFITRMPSGYDTELSESGSNLSQGQRQLLAIARAILSNPSILILDEATSSVDTRTELRIQQSMLKIMAGRTSFIIAHRLSTIIDADTILVIDNGQIVEKGNHESLINQNGVYHNLYYNQLQKLDISL